MKDMLKIIFKWIVILSFILIYQAAYALETKENQTIDNFITIADIHFNPYAGCEKMPVPCPILNKLREASYQNWESILEKNSDKSISGYYHDTNYALLKSTLFELGQINQKEHPYFVLVLGDWLAHSYRKQYIKYSGDKSAMRYQEFVKKTLKFLTQEMKQTFPDIDVYPVVGNNDSYTGNYNVVPRGAFLRDTAETWVTLIKDKTNQKNFLRDFSVGGYYVVNAD